MSDLYDKTRESWKEIWSNASIEAELDSLKHKRADDQLGVWPHYLPKEGLILEAGCGLGAILIYLREQGFQVLGLDYAENALHALYTHDPTFDLQTGDVHALPYRDQSLHGYLSFGVLEHFEHGMGPALREANRVLVEGGVIVLTIPYPNIVHKMVHLKRRLKGRGELTDEDFYESAYTQYDLARELRSAGFDIVLVRPTSHSFTLWGLGWPFRGRGYYQTTWLAEKAATVVRRVAPWSFNFTTMIIGRKVRDVK